MPKWLDDPFKKVSYSFRIEETLLNKVKLYAKATERKLPETFNYLIRESLKDCNLDNTYLNDFKGTLINITYITPVTSEFEGDIIEFAYSRGSTDYLDLENLGFMYEVKKIPNNCDVWDSEIGYHSQDPNLLHEGISAVIVPEIVHNENFIINSTYYLDDCLKYIYFSIDNLVNLEVKQISYKEAFRRLKEVGNNELLFKYKNIHKAITSFSTDFVLEYDRDPFPDIERYTEILYSHFVEFANTYNDGNINSLEDMKPVLKVTDLETDTNYITPEKDLNTIIEDLQNQINEKDQEIKKYEEMTNELKNNFNKLDERLKELESKRTDRL